MPVSRLENQSQRSPMRSGVMFMALSMALAQEGFEQCSRFANECWE